MSPDAGLAKEGRRLVREAATRAIALRLLGGVAIWIRASDEARAALARPYPDLDFASRKKQSRALRNLLEESGYEPERVFNAMHGSRRLLYHSADRAYHLDVFLDVFEMSHTLDLGARLEVEEPTLPAAELLLTKLQVAELNRKDVSDSIMLLYDHELADEDGPGKLNVGRVVELCAADWGLFTTIGDNLVRTRELVPELLAEEARRRTVMDRIDELERRLGAAPKTVAWKMRAKVGRRMRWYEVPEEIVR